MKKAIAVLAIAVTVILGSNGIVYAATGTGWIGRLMVQWSGEQKDVEFVTEKNSNGETYYIGTVQNEKGDSVTITTTDPIVLEGKSFRVDGTKIYVVLEDGTEKEIKVYDQEDGYTIGGVFVTPLPEQP